MSETLCTLRTKGGGGGAQYTETSLWTNQNPTSDFAAQTITLSDGMSNYKYLAIAFKAHKTSTDAVRTIISVEDLGKLESSINKPLIRFAGTNSTPTSVSRQFLKVSDTTISIGGGYYTNTSGSSNSYAIPTEILGLNELAHGTVQCISGTFTVSSGTTVTVTCGFQPSKLFIYTDADDSAMYTNSFDASLSQKQINGWRTSSSTYGCNTFAMNSGSSGEIQSITSTGFTFKGGSITTLHYVAIGSTTE